MAPSDCSICLMPIEPDESVVGLACAHLCHQECVQTHMRISRVPLMDFLRCPQCRMTSFDIVKLETALLDLPADAANTTSPARTWPRTPSPFSSPIADSSAEWESPSWRQWPHPEPVSQDAASLSWLLSERLFQCPTLLPCFHGRSRSLCSRTLRHCQGRCRSFGAGQDQWFGLSCGGSCQLRTLTGRSTEYSRHSVYSCRLWCVCG